jgi:hypothetical protein
MCWVLNLSIKIIQERKITMGLYMHSTMAVSPAPRRFRHLKKRESARAIPRIPLKTTIKISLPVIFAGKKTTPVIHSTGTNRMADIMVLYKLRATGRMFSPAFLKNMTAMAQRIAEDNARNFPRRSVVMT